MKIKIKRLESLIKSILLKKYSKVQANLIAEVIMFAEMSAKSSHGIIQLLTGKFSVMAQEPKGKPEIIKKTKFSALIKSKGNPGMLVGALAMLEVIKIARKNGFGLVGTQGSFSSSGCLSYYLEKIAKEDLIAIIMAQSPAATAPSGSLEPLFGTNPIGFAIPAKPKPLIFDMATSAITFGAILKAKEFGLKLPKNVAIDKEGNITTDPLKAIEGALLTFDNSYKGFGLAMIVEILSGIWPQADYSGLNVSGGWGNLFMALSPSLLIDINEFKNKVKKLIKKIRNSKTKNGAKIRIPGEKTINNRNKCLKTGEIEVDKKIIKQLENYREKENL